MDAAGQAPDQSIAAVDGSADAGQSADGGGSAGEVGFASETTADGGVSPSSDATDRPQPVPYPALAVATGRYHSCALLADHNVKCWGDNDFGQLGLGDAIARGKLPEQMGDALPRVDLGAGRTATAITAGRYATCAILDNQALKCWGWGGQISVPSNGNRGDEPGEMGDNLPAVDLGSGRFAKAVTVGTNESCALLDDDSVKCWGETRRVPESIALPPGTRPVALSECAGICVLLEDGRVLRPISVYLRNVIPQVVDLGEGVLARTIAGDEFGFCALLRRGGLTCKFFTTSKVPPDSVDMIALGFGFDFVCGMKSSGALTCWRGPDNTFKWEGDPPGSVRLGQPATQISNGGTAHICALLADGTIKCWGRNGLGQLGGYDPTTTDWPPVKLGTRPPAGP